MALTPEKLTYMLDRMKIQKELEESILKDIARRIAKTDYATETAAWQAERAQQAGILYSEVVGKVSRYTGKSKTEIEKLFAEAKVEIFDAGDSPTRAMDKVWKAALTKTFTTAKNLTKTTAITSQAAYIEAADLAHMQITSGAFTYQQAISNAVKSAADKGVTVRYPSGATASLDVAVRRAALTGVNQTAGKLCEMRCDELDCDLVETTAHYGARPSHAEWQGGVYSRSGKNPEYESLADATGYGSGDGLMGWNCNHGMHPFFEGVSVRNYTEEQLRDMKEHTVTYNGKTMTDYEASQKQRSYERQIRATKSRLTALNEAGKVTPSDENKNEFAAESVRLKKQEAKLKDFCNQTGRRSDTFRTQKLGFDRSVSGKAVWANRKAVDNKAKSVDSTAKNGIIKAKESVVKSAKDIQTFAEMKTYMKDNYGIIVDDSVGSLDFQSVREGVQGIEYVMREFPQAQSSFKTIGTGKSGLMSASYDGGIKFNSVYYQTRKGALQNHGIGEGISPSGLHPKGNNCFGSGAHEAGHILEKALIDKTNGGESFSNRLAWEDCIYAKTIVGNACKVAKKLPECKGMTNPQLRGAISIYAQSDASECLAEAVCDFSLNGEDAAPLSKEIWSILKKELG